VLSKPLVAHLRAMYLKDLDKLPQSKAYKDLINLIESRGEARGRALGEAKALLKYLDRRGVTLTAEQRARIEGCADAATVDGWLERAFAADTNEALLAAIFGPNG
jgi:hypothetical protein